MTTEKTVVLPVVGYVIAICDVGSVANDPGFIPRLLSAAREEEKRGSGLLADLWRTKVKPYCRSGDLALWTTLFDGVFKVGLVQHQQVDRQAALRGLNDDFVCGGENDSPILKCPSGEIVIASLSDLGSKNVCHFANVAKVTYWIGLERDFDQEAMHAELSRPEDYRASEGPDWTVHLVSQT